MSYRMYMMMAEELRLSPRLQARPAIRALWRMGFPLLLVWSYLGLFCATIVCEGVAFRFLANVACSRVPYTTVATTYAIALAILLVLIGIRLRRWMQTSGLLVLDGAIVLLGTLCALLLILVLPLDFWLR